MYHGGIYVGLEVNKERIMDLADHFCGVLDGVHQVRSVLRWLWIWLSLSMFSLL